ncbi:MAG: isocitrate/isopropylmalate dehydrogenase family protein [Candidatus Eisenbacteria bacterium]
MKHRITLIPGDGIGPELTRATCRALEATGVEIEWDVQTAGAEIMAFEGTPLPARVLDSLRTNRVGLKGPLTTPVGTGFRSVNVAIRTELDVYASVRPARTFPGIPNSFPAVDLVIIRENTESEYVGIEFENGSQTAAELRAFAQKHTQKVIREDSGIALRPISVTGSRRIVEYAFEYARRNGRRRVTAIHKANILKYTDGLFLEVAREVASQYQGIEFSDMIVDATCMNLVQRPQQFDVLVMPNLYGDILSDLCAGLVGGLGVAPGANMGARAAVFEPVHGSAPQFKGSGLMNPTAMMLSAALMLRHLDERQAAERLEGAIERVLAEGRSVTRDLLPPDQALRATTTEQMTDAIIAAMSPATV